MATVVLQSGALGTGKSTLRRLAPSFFRPRYGDVAAIDIDDIHMLVDPDWIIKDRDFGELTCENCTLLAENFIRHGFELVLITGNGLFHPGVVNRFLPRLLPLAEVYHFTLDAQEDVVIERVRQRGDLERHGTQGLKDWLEMVRQHAGDWTRIVDTSQEQPLETLHTLEELLDEGEGALQGLLPETE